MASGFVQSAALAAALVTGVTLAASVPAQARDTSVHVLNVVLPDGHVAQVSYRGAMPPHVVVVPVAAAAAPFAEFDRLSAMMDRQVDAMMQQAAALSRGTPALLAGMPAGASGTTYMATYSSDGACTRSTQITYAPGMARPQEISNVTGDCGAAPSGNAPTMIRVPASPTRRSKPLTTLARADQSAAEPTLQEAVWRR